MSTLTIVGAREGNLRDITLAIPKNKITVFTGVSGSGKSTLLVDVLATECQRLHLEALSMQGIPKPAVERVRGASPAIAILQDGANRNPRSTVGTATDVYTALRMVFEKLGEYPCPHCGEMLCAADCVEETERVGDDFRVYQFCPACGERMDKVTRTEFSFNTREGACPACEGMGEALSVDRTAAVDESLSLEDGAVAFWQAKYREYQIGVFRAACRHFGLPDPARVPVGAFDALQKALLYEGAEAPALKEALPHVAPPRKVADGRFEGVVPLLMRRLGERGPDAKGVRPYLVRAACPICGGERLGPRGRGATVAGTQLPQLANQSLRELAAWVRRVSAELGGPRRAMVKDYLLDMETKLARIGAVGLDYLTLDRATVTLSGGELQRLRLSAVLDSELSGVVYIRTSPPPACIPATRRASWTSCGTCATWATPCWSSSTTSTSCARPTTWWTWAPARAPAEGAWWPRGRSPTSPPHPAPPPGASSHARSRPRRRRARPGAPRSKYATPPGSTSTIWTLTSPPGAS